MNPTGGQLRINGLEIQSYNRYLEIARGVTLYVSSQTGTGNPIRGTFAMYDGGLEIIEGTLALEDTAGIWAGGAIRNRALSPTARPSNAPGTLLATRGTNLNITQQAGILGENLQIGGTPTTTTSTVGLGGMPTGQNLTLYDNVSISILGNGKLLLGQDGPAAPMTSGSSATSGGILKDAASPNSQITNAGTIERQGADPASLKVEPRVTSTGLFKMAKGTAVEFTNGFANNGGTIDIKEGNVKLPAGQKLSMDGGLMQLRGDGALAKCLFDGDVEIDGGTVYVGENQTPDASATNFVRMDVTGDLTLGADASVFLGVSIADNDVCDRITVGGTATVDGASLTTVWVNDPQWAWPSAGTRYWNLITSGGTAVGDWGGGGSEVTSYVPNYVVKERLNWNSGQTVFALAFQVDYMGEGDG